MLPMVQAWSGSLTVMRCRSS